MTTLKQEWDQAGGKLTRTCKVCAKIFTPQKWNQIICVDDFCKKGVFLKSHFQSSLKRWETWSQEAKQKGYTFV